MQRSIDENDPRSAIDHAYISRFDLNLLVAFDALMKERKVTSAARSIHVSQPAMSHSLARLRQLLKDDLFVRVSGGLRPTARAHEIAPEINKVLEAFQNRILRREEYDPTRSDRTFTVGMSDYASALILPTLTKRLADQAPQISLKVQPTDVADINDLLSADGFDMVIGAFDTAAPSFNITKLWEEGLSVLYKYVRLAPDGELDLRELERGRLAIYNRGERDDGGVIGKLTGEGLTDPTIVTTPHILVLPHLVDEQTNAIVPTSLAQQMVHKYELRSVPFPTHLYDRFQVNLLWNSTFDEDSGHRWIRSVIKDVAAVTLGWLAAT